MVTLFKKWLGLIAMTLAAFALVACGGGSSSSPDTTPPSVSAFSVKNGTAITAASDASYAVSDNVGTTQEYTLTFSEKLDASSYSVKMLDSSNAQVALPTGMAATLTANDSGNQTYTLAITTTNGAFVFDAGQANKAVKLQVSVTDMATNTAKVNVTETVNMGAPTVSANIPSSFTAVTRDWCSGSTTVQCGTVVPSSAFFLGCRNTNAFETCSFDLSSYVTSYSSLAFVSVGDPGSANGVGSPKVDISGNVLSLGFPLGYGGPYDIPITLNWTNAAGTSPNFVFTVKGMLN